MLMDKQGKITPRRGMPVDLTNIAKRNLVKSGEIIQLYYFSGSTYTIDMGEAAGTVVVGKTAYSPILGTLGGNVGRTGDSSFYFTNTALTTEVSLEDTAFEAVDYMLPVDAAKQLTDSLTNGQYVVDYRKGIIYGKKATTDSTLTEASYKVCALTTFEFANAVWTSPSTSPSSSISDSPSSSASVSSSPSESVSPSTSISSSRSVSVSSSISSSPSESLSSSSSSSLSVSSSISSSVSSSLSSSTSSSGSSSISSSPSESLSASSSISSSPSSSQSSSRSTSRSSSVSSSRSASPSASPSQG